MILSSSSTRVFIDARNFSSKSFISPAIGAFISLSVGEDITQVYNPGRVLQRELCGHTTARWTTPTRFFERITLPTGKSGSDFLLQFVDFGLRLFLAKGQGFLIKFDCLSQGFTLFAWR